VDRLRRAVDALDTAHPGATVDRYLARMRDLASAGLRTAIPATADRAALEAHAATAIEAGRKRLTALAAMESAFDRTAAHAAGQVAHDLARLREVFGASFPVAAAFRVTDGAQLARSSVDPALLGTDRLAPAAWLQQHALVRTGARRLVRALEAAEILTGAAGLEQLTVAQLPHAAGEQWLGLPARAVAKPTATVSIVAHRAGPIDFARPLAGLIVDQWADVIPNEQETTGISFHYDAPGARAPQTVLVAVPGDPDAVSWTVDSLAASVREAVALARIRPLDGDDLEAVGRFLPAIYLPFNIEAKTPSINLSAIIASAIELDNIKFLEEA
jgi:hypothetical protein